MSLFSTLVPDDVPRDFEDRLPAAIAAMEADDLIFRLEADPGDAGGDLFISDEGLDLFCRTVAPQAVLFGLTVQSVLQPGEVGITIVGGWRTGAGIWLADASDLASDRVLLQLVGPDFFSRFLDELLSPAEIDETFTMETAYAPDTLLATLDAAGAPRRTRAKRKPQAPAAAPCPSCGADAAPDARFCAACGQPLAAPAPDPSVCPHCGEGVRPGARFCRHCGIAL